MWLHAVQQIKMNPFYIYAVLLTAGCVGATVQSFVDNEIAPQIIPNAPAALAKVVYPSGVEVNEGNELTPTSVKDMPTVTWNAQPDKLYALAMTDPDAPSRADPKIREVHHWLVGNIPGGNVAEGEVLTAFIGSGPPLGTGLHRYVILVYEQPGKLTFDEPRICNTMRKNRANFSIAKFAAKYNLGGPCSGQLLPGAIR
ncbi:hypothetical protein ACJJTC_001550 [Scirpophaga incertulas]